jgi:hypothetical protein
MTFVEFLICCVACSAFAMAFRAHCRADGFDVDRREARRKWDALMENALDLQDRAEGLTRELRRRDRHTNDRIDILWNEVGIDVRAGRDPKPFGGDGFHLSLKD